MQRYMMDVLSSEIYSKWLNGEKVIICAPTGAGKTTFILKALLKYCKVLKRKMLILSNRILLSDQYEADLIQEYFRYAEMLEDVEVWTYQKLAEKVKKCKNFRNLFQGFDVVVCDEIHFFYNDSDFNPFGTYVLWQALVYAGFFKCMVMITATLDEVYPIVEKNFQRCAERFRREECLCQNLEQYEFHGKVYDYRDWADFGQFSCFYIPDSESLCAELVNSNGKSLVFIDDRQLAEQMKRNLVKTGKITDEEIFLLNAKVLCEKKNCETVRALVLAHKILPRVLITTSVLDNGISVHDPDVKNIVIATESKLSFMQMLGRLRKENCDACNLYIYPRTVAYYEKRIDQYEEKIRIFEKLRNENITDENLELLFSGWYGNDEKAQLLRNSLILTCDEIEYFAKKGAYVNFRRGNTRIAINEFAWEKAGNMLLAEKDFLRLAVIDPCEIAVKQISWIGKSKKDLIVKSSSFRAKREKMLVTALLSIQNATNEEYIRHKENITEEFRKDILAEY